METYSTVVTKQLAHHARQLPARYDELTCSSKLQISTRTADVGPECKGPNDGPQPLLLLLSSPTPQLPSSKPSLLQHSLNDMTFLASPASLAIHHQPSPQPCCGQKIVSCPSTPPAAFAMLRQDSCYLASSPPGPCLSTRPEAWSTTSCRFGAPHAA